jgi:LysM repeat protein
MILFDLFRRWLCGSLSVNKYTKSFVFSLIFYLFCDAYLFYDTNLNPQNSFMKRYIRWGAVGFCCWMLWVGAWAQSRNKTYEAYIATYKNLAIEQMQRYKIPASITLAQGLLESGAGQSELTRRSNNHFGIKCGSGWTGRTTTHNDDARNECFRVYSSARDSYEDHSLFLVNRPRYASLFQLKPTDYKGWAHGLKKAGYATSPTYASSLITLIELYNLQQYDMASGRGYASYATNSAYANAASGVTRPTYIANELLYVVARRGDTFKTLAKEFHTTATALIRYNDLYKGYTLKEGDIIYLHKKHRKALKPYKVHQVQSGESMHSISQRYGIKLKRLYKMNEKTPDYQPKPGDVLRLR